MPGAGTRQVVAVTSALALLGATFVLLFCTEQIAVRLWFAVAVTAGIVSFVTLLSRRLLFASVVALSLVALVFLASLKKQATMSMGLHSYDLFFYVNTDTLEFCGAIIAATLSELLQRSRPWQSSQRGMALRRDSELSRLASGVTFTVAVVAAGVFEPQASAESGAFRLFTQSNSFVSAFYLSWSETGALWRVDN